MCLGLHGQSQATHSGEENVEEEGTKGEQEEEAGKKRVLEERERQRETERDREREREREIESQPASHKHQAPGATKHPERPSTTRS